MAPSCVHLFPGITGLLLRNAASSWFPAWLWKKRGHQHPHAHSSRERSFPLHLLCHTKAAERRKDSAPSAPREAQPSPRLYPAAEPNKWTKAEAFSPLCLTTISRAKKEALLFYLCPALWSHSELCCMDSPPSTKKIYTGTVIDTMHSLGPFALQFWGLF